MNACRIAHVASFFNAQIDFYFSYIGDLSILFLHRMHFKHDCFFPCWASQEPQSDLNLSSYLHAARSLYTRFAHGSQPLFFRTVFWYLTIARLRGHVGIVPQRTQVGRCGTYNLAYVCIQKRHAVAQACCLCFSWWLLYSSSSSTKGSSGSHRFISVEHV